MLTYFQIPALGTNNKATRQHFMRDFGSWIATWVNRIRDREGSLFHHRYEDEAVLDVQALIDACVDATVAPVREGFTEALDDYTGASSWSWLQNGEVREGEWIDRDKLRSRRRTNPDLEEEACSVGYIVPLKDAPVEAYAERPNAATTSTFHEAPSPTGGSRPKSRCSHAPAI